MQRILLFDGVCNLCNRSVQFIIERDKKEKFIFASLQSDKGQELLKKFGLPTQNFDSFVLIEEDKFYQKSTASLRVFSEFGGLWVLLKVLLIIPAFIRNPFYSIIANNRYKWFGKQESCWLPTPELQKRFFK
ncbi:MAG: thiol-disulfide oxidoreductase DCC family protein [Cytophagales bacterium]|nr:thiol-disulfide oxidoreductase DCC family protein [Cytophagales bacterium]